MKDIIYNLVCDLIFFFKKKIIFFFGFQSGTSFAENINIFNFDEISASFIKNELKLSMSIKS